MDIALSEPGQLIAALPALIDESLRRAVAVLCLGPDSSVRGLQSFRFPDDLDPVARESLADVVAAMCRKKDPAAIVAVVIDDTPPFPAEGWFMFASQLHDRCAMHGIRIESVLATPAIAAGAPWVSLTAWRAGVVADPASSAVAAFVPIRAGLDETIARFVETLRDLGVDVQLRDGDEGRP
jgi:hypothetical protein